MYLCFKLKFNEYSKLKDDDEVLVFISIKSTVCRFAQT